MSNILRNSMKNVFFSITLLFLVLILSCKSNGKVETKDDFINEWRKVQFKDEFGDLDTSHVGMKIIIPSEILISDTKFDSGYVVAQYEIKDSFLTFKFYNINFETVIYLPDFKDIYINYKNSKGQTDATIGGFYDNALFEKPKYKNRLLSVILNEEEYLKFYIDFSDYTTIKTKFIFQLDTRKFKNSVINFDKLKYIDVQ